MTEPYLTESENRLLSRLRDGLSRAQRGLMTYTCFLTPFEIAFSERFLRSEKAESAVTFWGGYPNAERRRAFFLPSYLADLDGSAQEQLCACFAEDLEEAVCPLLIQGSGYRTLSHRDYLGSMLSLGLERDAVGDIIPLDNRSAVIFCGRTIADFLMQEMERVASDKVTVLHYSIDGSFAPAKETKPITDTVASHRLDCIVAALTDLSREKAQQLIRTGLCQVNYLTEDRCSISLTPPAVLTIRGYGKFNILAFDGETKKGRLRMIAEKYI